MIKKLVSGALFSAVLAGAAMAEPICEMRGAEEVPALEAAKAEFLKGDFSEFSNVATEIMGNARNQLKEPLERMGVLFPDGFESCAVVLQRRETGGMIQEVSTFVIKDQEFPMSLYLLAIPIRGEWKIAYLNFNSTLSDVLSSLR